MTRVIAFHFLLVLFISCTQVSKEFNQEDSSQFSGTITGTAVDRHGKALPGVLVTTSPGGYTTVSAADGRYQISGVSPGQYRISFIKADYRDTVTADSISVGLLDKKQVDNHPLTYRYATIRGKIRDQEGGSELIGVSAGVSVEDQEASASAISGSFILSRVEPGQVRIFGAVSGMGYGWIDTLVLPDDTLKGIDLRITRKGGKVSGSIYDSEKKAIAGATVTALGGALTSSTDNQGHYSLETIPSEGPVIISVNIDSNLLGTSVVQVTEGDSIQIPPVYFDQTVDADSLMVLPGTYTVPSNIDTLVLVAYSTWKSEEFKPYWYIWSLDGGATWDSTRSSSFIITGSKLSALWNLNGCGSQITQCSAIATIKATTASGSESKEAIHTIQTIPNITKGTMTDARDGKLYSTVKLGTQRWLAENLNFGLFQTAPNLAPDQPSKYCYEDSEINCDRWGGLYTWEMAMGLENSNPIPIAISDSIVQGICPDGWHLPSDREWYQLSDFIDLANDSLDNNNEAISLRDSSSLWSSAETWGGFFYNAKPAGYYDAQGYSDINLSANWWSATSFNTLNAYARNMDYAYYDLFSGYVLKSNAFSVRCVEDP